MREFVLTICLIRFFQVFSGSYGEVVFSELMIDPDPSVGLPPVEYVELFNRSHKALSTKDWTLYGGEKAYPFPASHLDSAGYCLLCASNAVQEFSSGVSVLGFKDFPVLNNTEKRLYVLNEKKELLCSITYHSAWHENPFKTQGGWSLECRDVNNLSGEALNWTSSKNLDGGTPGKLNSVSALLPDTLAPICARLYVLSPTQLELVFSKMMNPKTLLLPERFVAEPEDVVVKSVYPVFPEYRSVRVNLCEPLTWGATCRLKVSGLCDVSGLTLHDTTMMFCLPESPDEKDLSINELLFHPISKGCDYVEFVNVSDKCIDLSQVWLTNRDKNGRLNEGCRLSEKPLPCFPGSYWLLSVSADAVATANEGLPIPNALDLAFFPSMPEASGGVVLLTQSARVIDEAVYEESMHFPLIVSKEGVSLEKINPALSSTDAKSWCSASSTSGYGTPGYENSQYRDLELSDGSVFTLSGEWITPNNDGQNDVLMISYKTAEASVANIRVYDLNGRVVRTLAKNSLLASVGTFPWDGTADNGALVPLGRYVLTTECFTPAGKCCRGRFVLTVWF